MKDRLPLRVEDFRNYCAVYDAYTQECREIERVYWVEDTFKWPPGTKSIYQLIAVARMEAQRRADALTKEWTERKVLVDPSGYGRVMVVEPDGTRTIKRAY